MCKCFTTCTASKRTFLVLIAFPRTLLHSHSTYSNLAPVISTTLLDCRQPLARSFDSREYSGPGTALLMGAILLLPSHCPVGSFFSVAFFDPQSHWVDCLKLVQETCPYHELSHNCAGLWPR